jgi:GTP pyrophosphokinase
MLVGLGYGKLSIKYVLAELVDPTMLQEGPSESAIDRLLRPLKRKKAGGIKIQGIDDVLFRMAKCCSPVPGEPVIGFVTRGRGITVHAADCAVAHDQPEERQVEVEWDIGRETKTAPAEIMVRVQDRKGVLADVTSVINTMEINIEEIHSTHRSDDAVDLHFILQVRDIEQLNRLMLEARKVKGVIGVERVRHN